MSDEQCHFLVAGFCRNTHRLEEVPGLLSFVETPAPKDDARALAGFNKPDISAVSLKEPSDRSIGGLPIVVRAEFRLRSSVFLIGNV
ncbi:hypothetical protein [Brevibacterium aurantiacum]|uniref:hypothetical protein n=1 Tax=Brevibacterium aurantiacum TaxID=273384 RepID=UPI002153063F|nr:hypothetical protein [Brevibacterium aurantiacum]